MSDIEDVIKACTRIEDLLKLDFDAAGTGVANRAIGIADRLPTSTVNKARRIATLRNPFIHENQTKFKSESDRQIFFKLVEDIYDDLIKIARNSKFSNKTDHKQLIKYHNYVKLKHLKTGRRLHSHEYFYCHEGGSNQQEVTAHPGDNSDDLWIIKEADGDTNNRQNQPIKQGMIIRLEHVKTAKNLHSHKLISPITNQQEVTVYGKNGNGNSDDNWRIEFENNDEWHVKTEFKLIHVNTNCALHSHDAPYRLDQHEVTCVEGRDDNDFWIVSQL